MPLKNGIQGVQVILADYLGGTSSDAWKQLVMKIETSCSFRMQAKASNTTNWVDKVP